MGSTVNLARRGDRRSVKMSHFVVFRSDALPLRELARRLLPTVMSNKNTARNGGKENNMNTIFDMNPWSLLDELLGGDWTASGIVRNARNRAEGRFPPVNILIDDNAALIEAELPGHTAADIELTLEPETVTLADKPALPAEGDEKAANGEKTQPSWKRRIELPFRGDAEKATAKFENGILRINLPKAEQRTARRIPIATA